MIRLSDAAILAYTKLRTRKIRTAITVGVSGLLFSLLVFVLVVYSGVEQSIDNFSQEGLGKRYIVAASDGSIYNADPTKLYGDKDIIARANVIYKETIEAKKKEAKRLNIMYDPEIEIPPVDKRNQDGWLDLSSEAAQKALTEYTKAHPTKESLTNIKENLAPYRPTAYFVGQSATPGDGVLQTMKNGKEKFVEEDKNRNQYAGINPYEEADDPAATGLQILDGELTGPFILKNTKWQPNQGTIPVIITYNSAEKFLGIKKLASDATAKEKLARITEVRERAGNITFDICYRNTTSRALIDTAIATQKEIEKNKGKKEYKKPSLIYGLPAEDACGASPIASDTRTSAEKLYDERQKEFDRKFSGYEDPRQAKLKFRAVGLSPGVTASSGLATDIVSTLLNSSLNGSWIIPRDMYSKLPQEQRHSNVLEQEQGSSGFWFDYAGPTRQYYAEFANASDARAAIKKYSCGFGGCGQHDIYLAQYGSGSITLAEVKDGAIQGLTIVAAVIAGIAALIMAGTIGRMIADGRRETAVFRAIGAHRIDISLIYLVYTLLLSLRVAIFGLLLGLALAFVLNYYISPDATAGAQLMFGSSDLEKQFIFYGFASVELLYVVGLVFLTGLISMILPLLRNVRRNPIRDMRDE